MDTKRFVIGTTVGGIVLFVLGYVLFDLLLGSYMESASTSEAASVQREAPHLWSIGLACLAYAALICYAIGRRGVTGAAGGAMVAAVVGFLLWATADLMMYAFTTLMTSTMVVVDPLLAIVHAGIAGAVIGFVVSKVKPST